MKVLKEYEQRLKEIWTKAQQATGDKKQELMTEYQKVYRSYKIQQIIVQG